ncbi:BcsE family c-di-GMP-binding protein, partial [Escherichia coli]|uniref:BcsE family c-di-GMP-binding protein n=1 Tax=Escherichia coli TaxID=562 RepID=UPI00135506B4
PGTGFRLETALNAVWPNRTRDFMTLGGNSTVVFPLFCRINHLDTAFNHIFPLPTGHNFPNPMVLFEDDPISAQLVPMRLLAPE